MITSTIRFNFVLPGQDGHENSRRHRAAIAMAEAADRADLTAISLEEHHGVRVDDELLGWCASPFTIAAAMAARTERTTIGLWGIALPLHDPVRIAEDVATLDLLAPGRIVLIVNTGYREAEFIAHGQNFDDRAAVFEEKLAALLAAWTGDTVTPRPVTRPHPLLMMGGAAEDDARRAGVLGVPFRPSADVAALRQTYEQACQQAGHQPRYLPPHGRMAIVQIAEDPDEWWAAVGHHLLLEARVYAGWIGAGEHSAVHSTASTVAELRREGQYRVLTPDEAVAQARRDGSIVVHPLCGGTPLDRAEHTAGLFIDRVLPRLSA